MKSRRRQTRRLKRKIRSKQGRSRPYKWKIAIILVIITILTALSRLLI